MNLLEFLEKSTDILPKILTSSKIIILNMVSKKIKYIIEKNKLPVKFIFNNLYVAHYNKKSELIVKYLENNINKLNITNFTLNNCNIELIKELFQNNILQQYKNIVKFKFCNIEIIETKNRINNINILCEGLLQFPKLIELNLSNNFFEQIEIKNILNIVKKLRSLEILNLYGNNINNERINKGMKKLSSTLIHLTNLKELNLSTNYIKSNGIESLTEVLPKLIQLKSLNLSNNNLSQNGIKIICKGLIYLTNLNKLHLGRNYIKSEGVKSLIEVLPNLKMLINLNLSYNYFEPEGIDILANSLIHLTQLEKLNMHCNIIKFEGIESIVKILLNLTRLKSLNISHNLLGLDGINFLVKGISYLKQLNKLDISSNYIKSEGACDLIKVLSNSCTSITDLNLNNNQIGRDKSIFEVLNKCSVLKLKKLNLGYNNFGLYIVNNIIISNINTSLKYLDLSFNRFELFEILKLLEILKDNKTLYNLNLSRCVLDQNTKDILNKNILKYPMLTIDIL